jgi:hypothetical protein
MAKRKPKRKPKRWRFGWCDEDSPPKNGDCHDWKSKTFRVATFEKAMDKMLEFVRGKPFVCLVDYECRACHAPYSQKRHAECFPRIDRTEHELSEYVG